MTEICRRDFLAGAATAAVAANSAFGLQLPVTTTPTVMQADGHDVLNPRERVPLSFIIDDSTCLVNMGHFCTPQFLACYPDRKQYQKDWTKWPREIPDDFVREFGEWCGEHGVKGKYSIVPNPACVGWLDRELPGWSRKQLLASLQLVRELMLPNWDIHPEMITHTRVIDLKTGRPMESISPATMENSYPREEKSVDHLTEYLAYALRILKNCDLPCEGVTTPGGFGNLVKKNLSLAAQQAVREVYPDVEIPHYFKYVITGNESTEPRLEHVSGVGTDNVRLTVNVPCGTGDWFGGWQGDVLSQADRYANADATAGRMVELIEKGQPAVMLCHWPGMYSNGSKEGFHQFQRVVLALAKRFSNNTLWMKVSEMARYWTAKRLTRIVRKDRRVELNSPFDEPQFTLRIPNAANAPRLRIGALVKSLEKVEEASSLVSGSWRQDGDSIIVCTSLLAGESAIEW